MRFIVFLIFLCSSILSHAGDISQSLDEYLDALARVENFSGSVIVAKDNKILLSKGYGMANYEHDIPNQNNTKFRLASITKPFTAISILQLQEKNTLSVQDTISKHLPDYPGGEKITIRQLLSHTSGIPNATRLPDLREIETFQDSPDERLALFKNKPLDFEPGSQYGYSNSGYLVLGLIIEKITGKSYETYLEENIFHPLEMENSGYDSHSVVIKNRATGYVSTENNLSHAPYIDMLAPFAAGGLYSTVEDLYKLDRALYSNLLISTKSKQSMSTPALEYYGYGWFIHEAFGHKIVSHDGEISGFQTFFGRYPDDNAMIAVLSNVQNANIARISLVLSAILFGEPYSIPKIRIKARVAPSIFARYTGRYEFEQGMTIDITARDGKIFTQMTGAPIIEIFPESELHFFIKEFDAQLSFVLDDQGETVELILHQDGRERIVKKIR